MKSNRLVQVVVVAGTAALLLAACGSSSKSGGGKSGYPDFLAFSKCMRTHGVPAFPDPAPGGGIHLNPSSGINPASPSFQSAQANCRKLLPGGGPPQHASEQDKLAMLKISECMRSHGITGFPDPTTGPPPSPNGNSEVIDRGGVILAIPSTIDSQSPKFKHAAAACGFDG